MSGKVVSVVCVSSLVCSPFLFFFFFLLFPFFLFLFFLSASVLRGVKGANVSECMSGHEHMSPASSKLTLMCVVL